MKNSKEIKQIVKEKYGEIATKGCSCGCGRESGYSNKELKIAGETDLGLGCGNPVAFSEIMEGDTVLDLGSGAGIDCFLAAKRVGENGKVIGIDMTEEMIERARLNAEKQNVKNVEFILGEIESLPLKDNSVDVIITNCVINLAPDKEKVLTFLSARPSRGPGQAWAGSGLGLGWGCGKGRSAGFGGGVSPASRWKITITRVPSRREAPSGSGASSI